MKRSLGLFALLLLPFVPACDEPEDAPPPTIVDKSAEEAADITADAACEYVARCGMVQVSCADCAPGEDCGGCSTETIEISVEECQTEVAADLVTGFSCQPLTAEEEALVDECLAALPAAQCPSVDEDWSDDGEDPRDELQACEVLDEIMSRCYEYGEDDEPSSPPMPG